MMPYLQKEYFLISQQIYLHKKEIARHLNHHHVEEESKKELENIFHEIYEDIKSNIKQPYLVSLSSRGEIYPLVKIEDISRQEQIIFPWIISYKNFYLALQKQIPSKKLGTPLKEIKTYILQQYFKNFPKEFALIKIDEATTFGSHLFLVEALYELAQKNKDILPSKIYLYNIYAERYKNDPNASDTNKQRKSNLKKSKEIVKKINELYGEDKVIHKRYHISDSPIPWQDNEEYYKKIRVMYFPYPKYYFFEYPVFLQEKEKHIRLFLKYVYKIPTNVSLFFPEIISKNRLLNKKLLSLHYINGFVLLKDRYDLFSKYETSTLIWEMLCESMAKAIISSLYKDFDFLKDLDITSDNEKITIYRKKKQTMYAEISKKIKEDNIVNPFFMALFL